MAWRPNGMVFCAKANAFYEEARLPSIHLLSGWEYVSSYIGLQELIYFSTLRQKQNDRHFADDIFKGIFMNENVNIALKISLKFAPKFPFWNIPALYL